MPNYSLTEIRTHSRRVAEIEGSDNFQARKNPLRSQSMETDKPYQICREASSKDSSRQTSKNIKILLTVVWLYERKVSYIRIIVLTPNWVTISLLYRVFPMFLLLSLPVISFYICAWSSLLYLFYTISAYVTALSFYSFPIKLLLYFSYFLQDSLTHVHVILMSITSYYH